jgi:hypothetical protein
MAQWQTPKSKDILAYIRRLNFGYNVGNPEPKTRIQGMIDEAVHEYTQSLDGVCRTGLGKLGPLQRAMLGGATRTYYDPQSDELWVDEVPMEEFWNYDVKGKDGKYMYSAEFREAKRALNNSAEIQAAEVNGLNRLGKLLAKEDAQPDKAAQRKALPVASGFVDYFPDAMVAVAELSKVGNDQHNPGKPLHWDRSKSGDESDALMRHFIERGTVDTDGIRHTAKVAWRAMALLQKEIEAEGNDGPL